MDYFHKKPALKALIEENSLKTPAIVVAELACVLERRNEPKEKIRESLEFVLEKSIILELDFEHAKKAGTISTREKIGLSDAVVYSYASAEEPVLTRDKDFEGKPFVELVKKQS